MGFWFKHQVGSDTTLCHREYEEFRKSLLARCIDLDISIELRSSVQYTIRYTDLEFKKEFNSRGTNSGAISNHIGGG